MQLPNSPISPSPISASPIATGARDPRTVANELFDAVGSAVRGAPDTVRLALVALLSGGHLLVEGMPGTGKTLLAKSLAAAIGGRYGRVQCTPDLLPADVTGTSVYGPATGEWDFRPGPDLRQRRAGRRGQPGVAAHAGRACSSRWKSVRSPSTA